MTFTIGEQTPAGLCDRNVEPDGSENILKLPAPALVHVNVATGNERQTQIATEALESFQPFAIVAFTEQLDGNPDIAGKSFGEPASLFFVWHRSGQPQNETA